MLDQMLRRSSQRNADRPALRASQPSAKTSQRIAYGEPTRVVRIPLSLLPRVHKMLVQARADAADSAWLKKATRISK